MTTYEYLHNLIEEKFKSHLDKRQEVIDAIIDYYGENRVWVTVSREDYRNRIIQYLNDVFLADNRIYDSIQRHLTECSIEELQNIKTLQDPKISLSYNAFGINNRSATNIIVYYPEITLTNEYKEEHTIYDVYIKIQLREHRITNFTINRSTYSKTEILSGYIHSHTAHRNIRTYSSDFREYTDMCLGTGPIRTTLDTLRNIDCPIEMIGLFCQELDNYLKVESLAGGPYIKMSVLKTQQSYKPIYTTTEDNCYIKPNTAKQCALAIIKAGFLTFSNRNGTLVISNPYIELLQKVSEIVKNLDITEYSNFYARNKVQCIFSGMECKILKENTENINWDALKNKKVLVFKGKTILLKILDTQEQDDYVTILKPEIVESLLYYVTLYLNTYGYSKHIYS